MEEDENPFLSPKAQSRSLPGILPPDKQNNAFSRFAISTGMHFLIAISLVVGVFISQFLLLDWPGRTLSPLVFLLFATFGIAIIAGQLWIRDLGWGVAHFVLSLVISIGTWGVCWYIVSARALIEM